MKQLVFTHIFLNLYILAIIQPSLPILEYLVNYDYIKNELCENKEKPILACNGKCYLQKQVLEVDTNTNSNKIPIPPEIDFEKLIVIVNDQFLFNPCIIPTYKIKIFYYNILEDRISSSSIFRPPIS